MGSLSAAELRAGVAVICWVLGAAASGRAGIWGGLGGTAVIVGTVAVLYDRVTFARLLRPRLNPAALGVLAGLIMTALTLLLYPVMSRTAERIVRDTADLYTAFGALSPTRAALLLIPIVVAEEVIWRGLVQGALTAKLGRLSKRQTVTPTPTLMPSPAPASTGAGLPARRSWRRWGQRASALLASPGHTKALGLAAVVYALAMAPTGSPVLVLAALGCGLVWGGLRVVTGGLVAPIAAHLVWDALVLFVRPLI